MRCPYSSNPLREFEKRFADMVAHGWWDVIEPPLWSGQFKDYEGNPRPGGTLSSSVENSKAGTFAHRPVVL